jgi:CubicO group peptidase (beta-lactamase class C family)
MRRLLAATVLTCLVACGGCRGEPKNGDPRPTQEVQTPSLAERSQDVVDLHSSADGPGCSAAVAQQGQVVWQGVRGLADLESKTAITPDTVFDIGSVSKQFTATAILLLRDAGELRLQDPLADHLPSFPAWSKKTTLAHLMHHTSGIPAYEPLLQDQGFEFTDRATQRQAAQALAGVRKLDFTPGSKWVYTNSNYLLLAEVVRRVSGQDLPRYLKANVFDPLELNMVVEPTAAIPGKALSYQGSPPQFDVVDYQWELVGDGAIQTTPTELARWGDNYRTGEVGGANWLDAVLRDAVKGPPGPDGETGRYGAGIIADENGSIGHSGISGAFFTGFWVSPDRATSLAFSCNKDTDIIAMLTSLRTIWAPS